MASIKRVILLATFDTKGEEAHFLRQQLELRDLAVLGVDIGIGHAAVPGIDVSSEEVLAVTGNTVDGLRAYKDTGKAIQIMSTSASVLLHELMLKGRYDGVVGLGGGKGTAICAKAMEQFPWGFPKLIVSTQASGNTRRFIDCHDIILIPSIGDLMGLNPVTRAALYNAAVLTAGLIHDHQFPAKSCLASVGMTAFGVTTTAVMQCKALITRRSGREVIVFHASGSGGRAFEKSIRDGLVTSAIDLTLTEFADVVGKGIAPAGSDRLETASEMGIPQVVIPGAIDMVNLGDAEPENPDKYAYYYHTPISLLRRTTHEENEMMGKIIASKLSKTRGPSVVLIPMQGVSAYDAQGRQFFDPKAISIFADAVEANIPKWLPVVRCDRHINDQEFAEEAVEWLLRVESSR